MITRTRGTVTPTLEDEIQATDRYLGFGSLSVTDDIAPVLTDAYIFLSHQQHITGYGLRSEEVTFLQNIVAAQSELEHIGWMPPLQSYPVTFEVTSWEDGRFIPYWEDEAE